MLWRLAVSHPGFATVLRSKFQKRSCVPILAGSKGGKPPRIAADSLSGENRK